MVTAGQIQWILFWLALLGDRPMYWWVWIGALFFL